MDINQYCYTENNFKISKAPTFVKDSSNDLKKIKKQVKHNVKHIRKMHKKR